MIWRNKKYIFLNCLNIFLNIGTKVLMSLVYKIILQIDRYVLHSWKDSEMNNPPLVAHKK